MQGGGISAVSSAYITAAPPPIQDPQTGEVWLHPAAAPKATVPLLEKEKNTLTARTERVDPLEGFKIYKGGYNITNKHYKSSVVFTGKYGYAIASLWLLGGIIYGVLLIRNVQLNNTDRTEKKTSISFDRCRLWTIVLGVSLTLLAILASVVVLEVGIRLNSRAKPVERIIGATTQEATGIINNVRDSVKNMVAEMEHFGDTYYSKVFESMSDELTVQATSIRSMTEKKINVVNMHLKKLKMVTITTVVLNLVIVLSLLALASLRLRRAFHLLTIICWLLTTLLWMYSGVYFFLDEFAGDTCAALDEYRRPVNESVSPGNPCNDLHYARSIMREAGAAIHNVINQGNIVISFEQSFYPDLQLLCNPFAEPSLYKYQPGNCSSHTIQLADIPQAFKRFACSDNDDRTCKPGEFILLRDYRRLVAYTRSLQNILDYFPGMESLVSCKVLRNAFTGIVYKQCKPVRIYLRMTWEALVALSTIMVALVLTWTLEAHRDRRHQSSKDFVELQLTSTGMSEIYVAKIDFRMIDHVMKQT